MFDRELSVQQTLSILVFGLLLVLLPFFLVAVFVATSPESRARPGAQPREVVFSNISANGFTVSYLTDEAVTGSVQVSGGGGGIVPGSDVQDERGSQSERRLHYIEVRGLAPETRYTVTIFSDGNPLEDDAWKVSTTPVNDDLTPPDPYYGQIGSSGGEGVVYTMIGDESGNSTVGSALINPENGTFSIDRSTMLNSTGTPVKTDGRDILVFVNALTAGKAKDQVPATQKQIGQLNLSSSNLTFSPDETITPGSAPAEPVDDDVEEPDEPDGATTDYTLDAFSEGLLTSPFSSGAEAENPLVPFDVFISNVGSSGFSVNWRTKQATTGYVEILGENTEIVDPRDGTIEQLQPRYTHFVRPTSGSIPGGTEFEFVLIVDGIRFGRNLEEISADYDRQYAAYLQQYFSGNEGASADDADQAEVQTENADTLETAESEIPPFEYTLSSDIEIIPFRVIVPPTPDSPPVPIPFQGEAQALLDPALIALDLGRVETLQRDIVVAARTSDGVWLSDIVSANGTFSLSLGSGLTTEKTEFIEVTEGTELQMYSFGYAGQEVNTSITYDENLREGEPVALDLEGPLAITGINQAVLTTDPRLSGYAIPNAQITIDINGNSQTATANQDGYWQVFTDNLLVGENALEVQSADSNITLSFTLQVPELPVTSIPPELILVFIGILLVALGIIFYNLYAKK